jgi:hypothetical protein
MVAAMLTCAARVAAQTVEPPRLQAGQSLTAAAPGVSGRVLVDVLVGSTGAVEDARFVESQLTPAGVAGDELIARALERAHELKFVPALRGTQPLAARVRVAIAFGSGGAALEDAGVEARDAAAASGADARMRAAEANAVAPPAPDADLGSPGIRALHTDGAASAANSSMHRAVPPPMAAEHAAPPSGYGAHAHMAAGTGPASAIAASDLDIEIGALRAVPRPDAESYLALSPGVVLANHAGVGHASSIYLRGFDAGEGQDLEFRVDGVPINEPSNPHAHGYADTSFVIPELVQRLRVQQGPFDPRQGDFAVAGSVEYGLGVRERGLRAQLGYGEWNEQRALLLWAPSDATIGTFAAVDFRRGDGFGPNRAHAAVAAMARYARASGPLHYSLLVASHAQRYDSAGVIREDDYESRKLPCARDAESQFYCLEDPNQGGSAYRHLLSGKLSWARPNRRYELQVYGMLRGMRVREDFTGALLDPRGDGLDENYGVSTLGALAGYTLTPAWFGQRQRFELGFEARHDQGNTRMWRTRVDSAIPYATVFDRDLALTHVGAFVRAELTPVRYFSLRGGARLDAFGFHTENLAAPDADRVGRRLPRDVRDAWGTAASPRGALVAHLAKGLDWSVSAGLGVRSTDAEALSEGELAPFARVVALETGPSASLQPWTGASLEARAFAFTTRVQEDLLFDPNRGRNVPVGPSNRYGAALMARARGHDRFVRHDTMASFTLSEARTAAGRGVLELGGGERLPFVPRAVLRVDHASSARLALGREVLQLTAAGGLSWLGPRPLPLGVDSTSVWQLDLSLRARWRHLELGTSLENVFDVKNRVSEFNYASSFMNDDGAAASMRAVRHFAAGMPRTWWLTLTLYLDDRELI